MSTPAQRAQEAEEALVYPSQTVYAGRLVEWRIARDDYRGRVRDVRTEFAADLARTYLPDSNDRVRALVFDRAWEYGHSSGYTSVQDFYEELSDLVNLATEYARETG